MQAAAPSITRPSIGDLPNWLRDKTEHEAIKNFVRAEADKIELLVTYHDFLVTAADMLFEDGLSGPSYAKLKRWVLAGLAHSPADYQLRLRVVVSLLMRLQMHAFFPGKVRSAVPDICTDAHDRRPGLDFTAEDQAHELAFTLPQGMGLLDGPGDQSVEAWLKSELENARTDQRKRA